MRFLFLSALLLPLMGCADILTDTVAYGSIEVTASRRSGEPVPGVELYLYNPYQVHSHGFTDEEGRVLFERVPAFRYGVFATAPAGYDWPAGVLGGKPSPYIQDIFLGQGQQDSVGYTFAKIGPGRIEVFVREENGDPVEEGRVVLYSPTETLAEEELGPGGTVVFDPVSFGNRGIWVRPTALYLDEGELGPFHGGILVEDGWEEEVTFTLERCLGTLRARAVDQDGDPAQGVTMQLFRPTAIVAEEPTDAAGEAVFDGIQCQNFGISIGWSVGWAFERGRGTSFQDGLFVHRGSDDTATFTVSRRAGEVRVQLRYPDGSPVAGAPVLLYSSRGPWAEGVTGSDGWFSFLDVPHGQQYGLRVLPGQGYLVEEGRGTSFVDGIEVVIDGTVTRSFVVQPGDF